MKRGCPTGAAMPLCWSHAEYISLVRSRHDGVCFDRSRTGIPTLCGESGAEPSRDLDSAPSFAAHVSRKNLADHPRCGGNRRLVNRWLGRAPIVSDTIHESRLNLWFADFPTADWPAGSTLTFTFFWKRDQRWEGRDWQVSIFVNQLYWRAGRVSRRLLDWKRSRVCKPTGIVFRSLCRADGI